MEVESQIIKSQNSLNMMIWWFQYDFTANKFKYDSTAAYGEGWILFNSIKSLLIRPYINVNEKSFHYSVNSQIQAKSALYLAAEMENLEILMILLENKNIDKNIIDNI